MREGGMSNRNMPYIGRFDNILMTNMLPPHLSAFLGLRIRYRLFII